MVGGSCQAGNEENTCICTCPMNNGQERIWQFTKIPLNLILSPRKSDPGKPGYEVAFTSSSGQEVSNHFHLAALTDHGTPSSVSRTGLSSGLLSHAGTNPTPETLWLVLAQDTTEQQQVTRELTAKNADLVQLSRLKDEFLACITHELKTPLTAVLGLSSLLQEQVLGDLNERQARYVKLIHQSGRHLITIVNDMLDLTRMETGQLELILEPVMIAGVCDRALEQAAQLKPTVESPQPLQLNLASRIILEIEPGLDSLIADEMRLRQMLVNLLSNALKFTDVDGQVGLKVSAWEGWLAFTVWDTGIGIPAEKQHLVFQKFQQLENPLTRRFEGTGLGLVLTQRLARLHGGDITFTSKEGQGSQFTLLLPPRPPQNLGLPLSDEEHLDPHQRPPGTWPSSSYTMHAPPISRLALIVEASPPLIEALNEQLSSLGYRVAIARSGTEALEKARRLQPCVIFLNPLLPHLSGWDVLTLLKSGTETRNLQIVITGTRADKEQAYRNRADGFLSLPINRQALQYALAGLKSLPQVPEESVKQLIILYVRDGHAAPTSHEEHHKTELISFLQLHHYRILEVDDLEQAGLLARIWKINIVLLDAAIANPTSFIAQLSHHSSLVSCPLVTLTQGITQAANQIPGLSVFPCLAVSEQQLSAGQKPEMDALLQVIQVASGTSWRPGILVVDALKLLSPLCTETPRPNQPAKVESLQLLVNYVQTAGYRGLIADSWAEILHHLKHQSVDVLLVSLHHSNADSLNPNQESTLEQPILDPIFSESQAVFMLVEQLRTLDQIESKPLIFILADLDQLQNCGGVGQLQAITTQILSASLPAEELLGCMSQALTQQNYSDKVSGN
ncbi:MAG: ATP-binding protein, partial [Leptolyngbyaceae bacterium]|nr:ATP-binding protein [Leptolyngbyaceae bacterium]